MYKFYVSLYVSDVVLIGDSSNFLFTGTHALIEHSRTPHFFSSTIVELDVRAFIQKHKGHSFIRRKLPINWGVIVVPADTKEFATHKEAVDFVGTLKLGSTKERFLDTFKDISGSFDHDVH